MRDGCSGMGMAASRLQGERRCDSKGAGVTVVMVPEKTREKPHTSKLDPRAGRRAPKDLRPSPRIPPPPTLGAVPRAPCGACQACAVWRGAWVVPACGALELYAPTRCWGESYNRKKKKKKEDHSRRTVKCIESSRYVVE